MGNAECTRCCNEEPNESDVRVAAYPAATSHITRSDNGAQPQVFNVDGSIQQQQQPLPPTPIRHDALNEGKVQQIGVYSQPELSPEPVQQPPSQFGTPQQQPPGNETTPRSASDWAKDQEQFAHLPPLPEGWMRVKSRTTDAVYYFCKETGETTFTEPTAAQAIKSDPNLPPGWVEKTSRSTGKVYYWNTVLQRSQFERPTQNASVSTSPPSTSPPQQGNDNDGLPAGWVSMVSRSTGKTYYFNSQTQQSQFERPMA